MKAVFTLLALLGIIGLGVATTAPDREPPPEIEARFLVWLDCDPSDEEAVNGSLRLARSLCSPKSKLTVFLDGTAVHLMELASDKQATEPDAAIVQRLTSITRAGGELRVCPHCVERFAVDLSASHFPVREVTRDELEQLKAEADQIFQFRRPDEAPSDSPGSLETEQLTI
jgi:hypothetical protein